MIVNDLQPFSVVGDIGFTRPLNHMCINYLSKIYIVQDIYMKDRNMMQDITSSATTHLSLTGDAWTNSLENI